MRTALPLSRLRPDLDQGWPIGTRWLDAGPDRGPILEQQAGSTLVFPLTAESRMIHLRGTIEFAATEGKGTLGLRAALLDDRGEERASWRGRIRTRGGRVFPRRLEVDLSASMQGKCDLLLEATRGVEGPIHWLDLCLESTDDDPDSIEPVAIQIETPAPAPSTDGPLFSILTPVHDPPLDILAETLESVRSQTFTAWELCLVDDGSTEPAVTAALERAAAEDPRIKMRRHRHAGGISSATNAALEMARGEFVALLDHDDVLVPDALATVVAALGERPGTDMFYSDEELLADDRPGHVFAKPHWSPDLLRSQMYTCHLGVYRRSIADEIGGFRSGFDGSQDFDFALRFTERTSRVVHIPRILYRWRVHAGSSAGSTQAKPAAYPAARRAIAEHLERTDTRGDVYFGPWQGIYRVVHELPEMAQVAIGVVDASTPHLATAIARPQDSGVAAPTPFSAADLAATPDLTDGTHVLVLVDGDVEPLTRGWLSRLAAFALQPGVAAVGARTVAPDGRVEDGALTIAEGLPIPMLLGAEAGDPGPLGIGLLPANAAAVAGVVAISAASITAVGGLDSALGALAVPDFCLRAAASGLRIVSTPDVVMRRHGPVPINDLDQLDRFRRRWAAEFAADPYLDQAAGWPTLTPAR